MSFHLHPSSRLVSLPLSLRATPSRVRQECRRCIVSRYVAARGRTRRSQRRTPNSPLQHGTSPGSREGALARKAHSSRAAAERMLGLRVHAFRAQAAQPDDAPRAQALPRCHSVSARGTWTYEAARVLRWAGRGALRRASARQRRWSSAVSRQRCTGARRDAAAASAARRSWHAAAYHSVGSVIRWSEPTKGLFSAT